MSLKTLVPTPAGDPHAPVYLHRISEACRRLNSSRSHFYELVAANQITIVKLGRSSRVRSDELQRLIDSLPTITVARRERR